MLTIYPTTEQDSFHKIDKKIISMGNDYTLENSYGIGHGYDRENFIELMMLKKSLCQPICIHKKQILEIINKKLT